MDLISSLDHEEQSFLRLVDDIWQVDTDKVSHNTLITHFGNIVGHPAGSDLLFYPEIDEFGGISKTSVQLLKTNGIEAARQQLHALHQQKGI